MVSCCSVPCGHIFPVMCHWWQLERQISRKIGLKMPPFIINILKVASWCGLLSVLSESYQHQCFDTVLMQRDPRTQNNLWFLRNSEGGAGGDYFCSKTFHCIFVANKTRNVGQRSFGNSSIFVGAGVPNNTEKELSTYYVSCLWGEGGQKPP